MKKILMILALAACVQVASAQQVKSLASARSAVESAQKATEKKPDKIANWLKLGQAYIDAYNAPMGNGWLGATQQDLALVMGKEVPSSEEEVVLAGQPYVKAVYDTRNYYYGADGRLSIIEVTQPIFPDALDSAVEAYKKAIELDPAGKKAEDISTALNTISGKFTQEAYDAYTFGDYKKASFLFEKAAEVSAVYPGAEIDVNAVYNAGFTAWYAGDNVRAKGFFEKSIEYGYESEGEVYAKLADISEKLGDQEARRDYLEQGFQKYPQSQSILIGLINYYVGTGGDTSRLFELLDIAKVNEPNNPSLYYVEGNIHNELGEEEAAIASYDKCNEINPEYEYGFIGKGIMFYNKAVDYQDLASNEMDDAKYMEYAAAFEKYLKDCIEPFEKAYELSKDEGVKGNIAQYLKNACFRFRGESDEYMAKYEKYAAAASE